MGYRNDQYFNLRQAGEAVGLSPNDPRSGAEIGALNKDFVYPDRSVRVNSVLDAGNFTVEPKLQRGYIRSIADSLGGVKLTRSKCQFQFNPRVLNTSVNQNTKILDFLHQDASQYAQPIPGNVSFSFGLFFDRSYELNKGGSETATGYDVSSDNPWEKYGPETIGVLHDISALYSVIGQGIGSQQKQYIQSVLESQIKGEINAQNTNATITTDADGNVVDDGGGVSDAASTQANYTTAADDFINNLGNTGNVAFLLPLPVRVVFSALYIVEGLVQNASVKFTKFNHAMVPMQGSVELVMEAKYVGFAKKNTFFTEVLAKREEVALQEAQKIQQDREQAQYFADKFSADLNKAKFKVEVDYTTDSDSFNSKTVEDMVTHVASGTHKSTSIKTRMSVEFPSEGGSKQVRNLYAEGKTVEVQTNAEVELWRYTDVFKDENAALFNDSSDEGQTALYEALEEWANYQDSRGEKDRTSLPTLYSGTAPFRNVMKIRRHWITPTMNTDRGKPTAVTEDEYKDLCNGIRTGAAAGSDDRSIDSSREAADPDNFYYLLRYYVKVSATVDGATVTGEGSQLYVRDVKGANFSTERTIDMDWPTYNEEEEA